MTNPRCSECGHQLVETNDGRLVCCHRLCGAYGDPQEPDTASEPDGPSTVDEGPYVNRWDEVRAAIERGRNAQAARLQTIHLKEPSR